MMGLAPEPGSVKRAEEHAESIQAAQQILTFTYDGQVLPLAWRNVPVLEKVAVRKATGIPFSMFMESAIVGDGVVMIDEDSFCVFWWLARRAAGERSLDWPTAVAEWDQSKIDDISVSGVDDVPDEVVEDPQS